MKLTQLVSRPHGGKRGAPSAGQQPIRHFLSPVTILRTGPGWRRGNGRGWSSKMPSEFTPGIPRGGWHLGPPTQPPKLPSGRAQMPSGRSFPQARPQPWNQQVFESPESPSTGERGFLVPFAPATQGGGEISPPFVPGQGQRGAGHPHGPGGLCLVPPRCWLRGRGVPDFAVQSDLSV